MGKRADGQTGLHELMTLEVGPPEDDCPRCSERLNVMMVEVRLVSPPCVDSGVGCLEPKTAPELSCTITSLDEKAD